MEFSRPHVINEATIEYLKTLDPQNPPNPETIAETILTVTTEKCREVNATRSKGETKWRLPTELTEEQVARILATLYPVKRLSYLDDPKADNDYILGLYQTEGENKGIYTVSDLAFKNIIKQYNNDFDDNNCKKVKQHLESYVETTGLCRDKDLVAVNNGIFNSMNCQNRMPVKNCWAIIVSITILLKIFGINFVTCLFGICSLMSFYMNYIKAISTWLTHKALLWVEILSQES